MFKNETSIRGKIISSLITQVTSSRLIGKRIRRAEHLTKLAEPSWKCPKGYEHERILRGPFEMEILRREEPNENHVILQLHGGGYIAKLRNSHRNMAKRYSDLGGGISVVTPDYRVAPEHPYPAALEDAISSYDWLLEKGFSHNQIIVVGDSAGGGLAMALCHYLKAQGRSLPIGIVAMSPWTDMTASGWSYDLNFEKDPLFGNTTDSVLYNRDYLGKEREDKPYVSPMFGDFHGFPPMLIQVGSIEMLLSDSIEVAKKARDSGVNVYLHVYKGMFHNFQMAEELIPESREAWQEIEVFIKDISRSSMEHNQ